MPEPLLKDLGNFNVFRRNQFRRQNNPMPYCYRDYYKIILLLGRTRIDYADQSIETGQASLLFVTPRVPHSWQSLDNSCEGYFCIFTPTFLHHFGNSEEYPVFQPGKHHIYELNKRQIQQSEEIYRRMFSELNSDYKYKYEIIKLLILELAHIALKQEQSMVIGHGESSAAQRLAIHFSELLERQFPIDSPHQQITLRTPSDFANALSVHVNHLNRCLIQVTGRTTTQWIGDRIALESRSLLRLSTWNISEIAYSLGFREPGQFTGFFKKHFSQTPKQFRSVENV